MQRATFQVLKHLLNFKFQETWQFRCFQELGCPFSPLVWMTLRWNLLQPRLSQWPIRAEAMISRWPRQEQWRFYRFYPHQLFFDHENEGLRTLRWFQYTEMVVIFRNQQVVILSESTNWKLPKKTCSLQHPAKWFWETVKTSNNLWWQRCQFIQIVQVTGFGDALDVLQDDGGHFRQGLGDHHITLRQDEDLSSILQLSKDSKLRIWHTKL